MRTFLTWLGVVVLGTVLGLAATWATVIHGGWGGAVSDGPWKTSLTAGSSAAGMYQRASVAVHGLLALNRSETIYYTANTDDTGEPLRGACTYQLVFADLPARWWSITAYGADDYLIPNPANRYSVSKASVGLGEDSMFWVRVAKNEIDPAWKKILSNWRMPPQSGGVANWIPVGDGPFSLTLRLYDPDAKVAADPAHVNLPAITRKSCP